jgi:glycosyltransferase involved in cell wall biosynthesis
VRELGGVDLQDKTDLLRASELVCLPSTQEAFGGVLVEGWASGKPVVGGPAAAIAEVIEDGRDGLYIKSQSAPLLAERVNWILDNPAKAAQFAEAGAQKVREHFTWDRLAAKTESIYRSLG